MATYSGSALLLAMRGRTSMLKTFKKHLNDRHSEHGTDSCTYCRMIAEDLGLLLGR